MAAGEPSDKWARCKSALITAKSRTQALFAKIPFFGPLAYCSWRHHAAALRELTIVVVFATAAFWLTSILLMGYHNYRAAGYMSALLSTVKNGELFIFTVGFLGPILLQSAEDKKNEKEFPQRMWHLLVLILLAMIAAGFHAQIKSAQVNSSTVQADLAFWFEASCWMAGAAVLLRYLAMVFRKSTASFSPETEIRGPEHSFVDLYAQHRGAMPTSTSEGGGQ